MHGLDDHGVTELLNPHRVDWYDRGTEPFVPRPVKRRRDLTFHDDEGSHQLVTTEAGGDVI